VETACTWLVNGQGVAVPCVDPLRGAVVHVRNTTAQTSRRAAMTGRHADMTCANVSGHAHVTYLLVQVHDGNVQTAF
jgi:hypothetical protein